jgi:AcrR family transcriptional regulator
MSSFASREGPLSEKRRSGAERREEIVNATATLMREQGLAALTTRDVTGRLGVGAGLLNHYFTWSELRALAFERVIRADLDAPAPAGETPAAALASLLDGAFLPDADPGWRVWMEAIEAARGDPALDAAVARCEAMLLDRIARILEAGHASGAWRCADPRAAAWRILALHDGLVGFLLATPPRMTRAEAARHLCHLVALECPGWAPLDGAA